ncbi:MAG: AAA+ family ATPase [Candidatus Methanogaster sp.]|uniref:AAA+ family ATPase n=1 Tax=Candidatus Methanogaster sp. TaxID=3386292 RepID=A0AC61L5E2_9EURY|nr:MAG: AAA+ family ATPase [ANME-2 cluster archaeon]
MDENARIALERQNPWWFGKEFETGINRLQSHPRLRRYMEAGEILLLVGARRTGKSTLVYQIIKDLLQRGTPPEAILFVNLDEPLFQSRSKDPAHLTGLINHHLAQHSQELRFYVFLDEIQSQYYWVQAVKTLHDVRKDIKIVLTDSTSTLLQSEISTKLSGRYFHITVYPLSFAEYLNFKHVRRPTTIEMIRHFGDYLEYGAFPRVVLEDDRDLKRKILKNYFQTIYLKDIIYPNNIRNNKDVFDLLYFAISNVGKSFSYSSIGKTLGIASETVKEYLWYAESSYLLYTLTKYDVSVKKQIANPKKLYCLDTGLVNSVSFKFSENRGRLLENLVCTVLRRENKEIYYHKGNYECDFLIRDGLKVTCALQVTLSLQDDATRKREMRGLLEAMKAHNLDKGTIISEKESDVLAMGDKTIRIDPIYKWLRSDMGGVRN